MTGLEIGLAVALGLVVVFAVIILGACIEQGGLTRSRDVAKACMETDRYKEVEEEPSPAYLQALRQGHMVRQSQHATAPYPTLPPFDGCKVCGAGAYTYRWGQCLTTWRSGSNEETTRATVDWRKYDVNYDVGWFPVCAHHATVLDKYGTVGTRRLGHRRTGGYSCG